MKVVRAPRWLRRLADRRALTAAECPRALADAGLAAILHAWYDAGWLRLNIVGDYIEMLRDVALDGRLPNIFGYLLVVAVSYAVFIGGYQFFQRYKSVIVDVI